MLIGFPDDENVGTDDISDVIAQLIAMLLRRFYF